MKAIFIVLFPLFITACNSFDTSSLQQSNLLIFIDSFANANPGFYNYDSTEERGDSIFKATFLNGCIRNHLLENFPFKFMDIRKSLRGNYYAHFTEAATYIGHWQNFIDIVMPVDEEVRNSLVEGKIYKFKQISMFRPAEQPWKFNINLGTRGIEPYLITEDKRSKIALLGLNWVEADLEKF